MFQDADAVQAAVDPIERITVKRHRENVMKRQHDDGINRVQSHTDKKCPLLASAGKIPEKNEYAREAGIDDQIRRHSALAGLMRERVHELRNAQAENETNSGAAHGEDGVDQRENADHQKPARSAFDDALGTQLLLDQVGKRRLRLWVTKSCSGTGHVLLQQRRIRGVREIVAAWRRRSSEKLEY